MLYAKVLLFPKEFSRHLFHLGLLSVGQLRLRPRQEVEDREFLLR